MAKNDDKPIRVHKRFIDEIEQISRIRFQNRMDKKLLNPKRITLGMVRHPDWEKMRKDLATWPFVDDRGNSR